MIGKNGWVFYNKVAIFKNTLEERKEYLESKDIDYLFAFWQNKHTIYPEELPYPLKIQIKDTLGQADQLINFLKDNNSNFNFIEVRSALLAKKAENQIYRKLDTHWNSLGAYFAYNEFLKQASKEIKVVPIQIEEFTVSWELSNEGDSVNMLGINQNDVLSEKLPALTFKT